MFRRFSSSNTRIRSLGVISLGIGCAGCLAWCFQQTKEKGVLRTSFLKLKEGENETGIFQNVVKCEANEQKTLKYINHISDQTPESCKCSGHTKHGAKLKLALAIEKARNIVKQKKEECGTPGMAVAVSVDGRAVWSEGLGYSDVENNVKCTPDTVFRIASISKSLTATLVAQLWEQKKLDLDAPVQKYVPSFPEKSYGGEKVTLTTRHLLSHLGGIRHYHTKQNSNQKKKNEDNQENILKECREPEKKSEETNSITTKLESDKNDSRNEKSKNGEKSSTEVEEKQKKDNLLKEFFNKDHYKSVTEALALFKDDPLTSEPGAKYFYTTYGWTLVSAVIEGVTKEDFLKSMKKLFREIGMDNTIEEKHRNIIYNRSRNYQRNQLGHLLNAPYVDLSCKWAGGGFLSTVGDLIKFGNAMLYASQVESEQEQNMSGASHLLPGILQSSTVDEMWKVAPKTEGLATGNSDAGYGQGWMVLPEIQRFGSCRHIRKLVTHSGNAAGASSVLVIKPHEHSSLLGTCPLHDQDNVMNDQSRDTRLPPQGIVVAILVNMEKVGLEKTALALIECFEESS